MKNFKFDFRIIWGIFMTLAYVGIAYLVVFTPLLLPYTRSRSMNPADDQYFLMRIILGVTLFVYGLFRGYRMWKTMK